MIKTRILGPAIATALMAGGFIAGSADDGWESRANKRKAEYIFMEAMRRDAANQSAEYLSLLESAYAHDTTDAYVGSQLGMNLVSLAEDVDNVLVYFAEDLFRKQYEADPSDLVNSRLYSFCLKASNSWDEYVDVYRKLDSIYPENPEVTKMYINALLECSRDSNVVKAIERLDLLEMSQAPSTDLLDLYGSAYELQGDSISYIKKIKKYISMSPLSPLYYLYAGHYYGVTDEPDSARIYLERACEVDPYDGRAFSVAADFYLEMGDTIRYRDNIRRALLECDLDVDSKHDILLNYTRNLITDSSSQTEVNSLFQNVIATAPYEPKLRVLYMAYLLSGDDYNAIAEQLDYVMDIMGDDFDMWDSAIKVNAEIQDRPKTERIIDRALTLYPDSLYLYISSAQAMMTLNDTLAAFDFVKTGKDHFPADYNNRMKSRYLGYIADMGQNAHVPIDTVSDYYRQSIELNPENMMSANNWAYMLAERGVDLDLAEILSKQTVESDPNSYMYLDTLAWIYFKKGDYEEAKRLIDKAFSNFPLYQLSGAADIVDSDLITEQTARMAERMENDPKFKDEFNNKIKDFENITSDYFQHAGDIYYMNGLTDTAVKLWEEGLVADPEDQILKERIKTKSLNF